MADTKNSAGQTNPEETQGSWVSNLLNFINPGSDASKPSEPAKSETAEEGWTGGIGAMIGGVVETAREVIHQTTDAVANAAHEVKETFVGADDEASPGPSKHAHERDESSIEPTEKRQRLPEHVKDKIASGVELEETATERRSRAKQQWKREHPSQPQQASEPQQAVADQPSGDVESEESTKINDALLQQPTERRVIGKLTDANLNLYTAQPPAKYKESSKAFPSTYHPPQPTLSKNHKMNDARSGNEQYRGSMGQAS